MSSSSSKMLILRSSDGEMFDVEETVAVQALTIKRCIEDYDCNDDMITIPLPTVTSDVLTKVIEYLKKHSKNDHEDDLKSWDQDFVNVDQFMLYHLLIAANYMDIKSLVDLLVEKVASMIRGKSPQEIRKLFNIQNDFTREEEEAIRKENPWAFE